MSRGGLEIRDFFAINNRLGIRKIEFRIFFCLIFKWIDYIFLEFHLRNWKADFMERTFESLEFRGL